MNAAGGNGTGIRDATAAELADWDTVSDEAPGGHVYQSRAWAEHRRASGWQPHFLIGDDGGRTLALVRRWPFIPGASAYVPRGPVGLADGRLQGERLIAVADALAAEGSTSSRPIQRCRRAALVPHHHRGRRVPPDPGDPAVAPSHLAAARPRRRRGGSSTAFPSPPDSGSRRGEAGVVVVRHDHMPEWTRTARVGEGLRGPAGTADAAFDRFYDLLLETGARKHFSWPAGGSSAGGGLRSMQGTSSTRGTRRHGQRRPACRAGPKYRHGGPVDGPPGDHAGADDASGGAPPAPLARRSSWRSARGRRRWIWVAWTCRAQGKAGRGRPALRPLPAQDLVRRPMLELTRCTERVSDARGYQAGRLTSRVARLRPMRRPLHRRALLAPRSPPRRPRAGLIERLGAGSGGAGCPARRPGDRSAGLRTSPSAA